MTPELLTFLDAIKGKDITTLYGLIEEVEKRRQSTTNEAPFYEAVKTALEDAINLHRQNRVFVFSDGKLEILPVGDYCDRYQVATLDQFVFRDERCITQGTVSAKEPATTTSAPLAKAMIDTYAGNDVQLSDDWFNTISETAYTGVDATALEMLTYVFEWTYTYKDWLKLARNRPNDSVYRPLPWTSDYVYAPYSTWFDLPYNIERRLVSAKEKTTVTDIFVDRCGYLRLSRRTTARQTRLMRATLSEIVRQGLYSQRRHF